MQSFNRFIRLLYSNPSLLWKAGAALIFVTMGGCLFLLPNLAAGLEKGSRLLFAGIMLVYGLFRFSTFWMEYKQLLHEDNN